MIRSSAKELRAADGVRPTPPVVRDEPAVRRPEPTARGPAPPPPPPAPVQRSVEPARAAQPERTARGPVPEPLPPPPPEPRVEPAPPPASHEEDEDTGISARVRARQEARAEAVPLNDLMSSVRPRLTVERSPSLASGTTVWLDSGMTIGRSRSSGLPVADSFVSHMHARIFRRGQFLFIEDLGSTNGTFVNDRRISEETQLKVRDKVRMGDTVLRYEE